MRYPEALLKHLGRIYLSRSYLPPDGTLEGKRVQQFEEYLAQLGVKSLYDHTNMQLVDRAIASRAGLVTYGRNNFVYADELGSFIVLVTIPVDTELECEVDPFLEWLAYEFDLEKMLFCDDEYYEACIRL